MPETISLDILNFMVTKPEIVWLLSLMGAVCVIGVVEYLKCFFEKKKNATRWVVLFLSLSVAVVISPLVPNIITTVVIIWLLIIALSTIGKKNIIDGIGGIINKMTGVSVNNKQENK
jgi:hypothetical protein